MEMPKNCIKGGCPLDGAACDLWEDKNWEDWHDPHIMRHPDCPLIELPPHGRLIDADALWENITVAYPSIIRAIDDAPTIIPAEKDGDGNG